jgi:hypothetical protein
MRILICGDRNWSNLSFLKKFIDSIPFDSVVIEGEARGVDLLSKAYARKRNLDVIQFPANWMKYGAAAGPIRNSQMLEEGLPDIVTAFHFNIAESKSTKNMLIQAKNKGVKTYLNPSSFQELENFKYD